MINSSHALLVFAMLSTASGWGLPSHDSLLSPNESGVDGPRDRRQLQGSPSGSSCDYWSALPAPRASWRLMPNIAAAFLLAATHKPPLLPRVTSRVTPAVIGVATKAVILDSRFATTAVIGVATPTATPVATPVEFRPAAILAATRASVSPVLLTIPAPQRTSLVWPMCRGSLARQTDRPVHPHLSPPSRARRRHPE